MNSQSPAKYFIAIGFLLGAVLGFGGSMVEAGSTMQKCMWEISSLGLIMAAILYARTPIMSGDIFASSGFVILAIAEAIMSSGTLVGEASQATFGAGTGLYGPALILIAMSSFFAMWIRGAAALSGIAFLIVAGKIFSGEMVGYSSPFPSAGYALLTLATLGWVWTVLRKPKA